MWRCQHYMSLFFGVSQDMVTHEPVFVLQNPYYCIPNKNVWMLSFTFYSNLYFHYYCIIQRLCGIVSWHVHMLSTCILYQTSKLIDIQAVFLGCRITLLEPTVAPKNNGEMNSPAGYLIVTILAARCRCWYISSEFSLGAVTDQCCVYN